QTTGKSARIVSRSVDARAEVIGGADLPIIVTQHCEQVLELIAGTIEIRETIYSVAGVQKRLPQGRSRAGSRQHKSRCSGARKRDLPGSARPYNGAFGYNTPGCNTTRVARRTRAVCKHGTRYFRERLVAVCHRATAAQVRNQRPILALHVACDVEELLVLHNREADRPAQLV